MYLCIFLLLWEGKANPNQTLWKCINKIKLQQEITSKHLPNYLVSISYFAYTTEVTLDHSDRISYFLFQSTTLTPPGPPRVSKEAELSTKFKFGGLVR